MATAKKLTENHLTCVICTEVFTDPATLHCHHTFCKSCLLKYTNTQPEALQAKSIRCPSCRQLTTVTNPDSPVEEWVSQLKPSHVIQGLMDDFGPGTRTVEEHLCSVCTKQGKTTPATSWCSVCDVVFCEGCLQMHNMMPGLCDHEVAHLSDHIKTKVKRRFMCKVHRDEKVKLFCKDCKKAICTICCSIKHRTCKDVDTIESMTPLVKEQLTNKIEHLRINMAATNNNITWRKSTIQDVKSNSQTLRDKVIKTRETVMRTILRKEKQLLGDIDKATDEQLHELHAGIKSKEIELQMYQQQYEFTANAVTSNCEMDMYAVYESVGETSTDNRDTDNRPAAGSVVFTHDLDKLSKAVDELQLGEVQVVHGVSDPGPSPVLHHTIDYKEAGDGRDPCLFDVTVLTVDGIKVVVVADYNNKRLLTYYTSNFKSFDNQLLLSCCPYQIAKLSESQIAVCVPGSKEIVTVNVTPGPVLLSTIKTSEQYWALACLSPSQLAAGGYGQSHSVDILDMTGRILRSINTGLIDDPAFIHVTRNNNLIVSEREVKSLVCVTSEGDAVFTYTPTVDRALSFPQGVTTTSTGDILLVDTDSHKVIQLTESGQFVRDVLTKLDGLIHPSGVCLDGDGLLYVTSDRYVKVFKFYWRSKLCHVTRASKQEVGRLQRAGAPIVISMATAKKLTENHLSCAICTEVFTDPATLHCHHTFCKSCLLKYTYTQPEAVQAKSIRCPSCRQQTKVTNPDSPVEEWVSQLKPSHVIQGLMDDFGPDTRAVEEHLCSVCTKQGKTTPATIWCSVCDVVFCEGCLQLHNMMPGLCDHEVAHLSDHTKTKVKRRFMCKVHRDEKVKLFCKDCKQAICTICCSIKHRTCKDVDTIESTIPLVKEQLTCKIEKLGINIAATNNIITQRKSTIQDVKNNSQTLKDQVIKTRETVMRAILRKEKQLLGDIDKATDEQLHELQADIKSQKIELQMYQQQYEFTSNAVTSNCEVDMYAIYESMGATSTDNRDTGYRPAAGRVVFTHDLDKLSKAVDELQLGEVEVIHDVSDPESSPVLYHTIDCKEDGDGEDPWLVDVTVLTVGDIKVTVVADYYNTSLETYYTSNLQSFHNQLLLSDSPFQIAKLCESQIFVSVPDSKEIVTVNVTPSPVLLSTIKTSKDYYALAFLSPSQLAAGTYRQSHSVDILDMTGRILRSINTGVIGSPDYIHVTRNNNLIVSEREVKSLVCVTSEGDAVFTHTPTGDRALTHPRGITTTSTGDILLVDYDSDKVIQLTESGQFVRDVLTQQDGLIDPCGVSLDGDGLLYVTSDRYVKVFKFYRR
ncbi:uncharacterized protein LOC124136015 [Haliotis rufescens]|uniref:uncharacterized protein LOC124136015 n=1 Tax=Haliotis rufescens TaxID=6454 RepID=UPI00201E8ABB|nr:uncharacterized protein LOC124136015 [Haliotis rufescens]